MRLIGSLYTPEAVVAFVRLLESHHIAHNIETHIVTDWGSPTYGDRSWMVWIINEEDLPTAQKLYGELIKEYDPLAPSNPISPNATTLSPAFNRPDVEISGESDPRLMKQPPLKIITALILFICLFCFGASYYLTPSSSRGELFATPLIPTDPIKKTFLYDFPPLYALLNQFFHATKNLSEAERQNYSIQVAESFQPKPVWQGYYTIALSWLKNASSWQEELNAPRFEKIQQGEIWRLITPIFLHQNLLHLLFNLLWIYLLGRQLEAGLGSMRYLLFCLIVALVSNTAQYLMSGPNFLGISGLVCGMVTYIWVRMRQNKYIIGATDYFLAPGTLQGLAIFVCALFTMQLLSFLLEATTSNVIPIGVANTAHLTGALCGVLLASIPASKRKYR